MISQLTGIMKRNLLKRLFFFLRACFFATVLLSFSGVQSLEPGTEETASSSVDEFHSKKIVVHFCRSRSASRYEEARENTIYIASTKNSAFPIDPFIIHLGSDGISMDGIRFILNNLGYPTSDVRALQAELVRVSRLAKTICADSVQFSLTEYTQGIPV